MDIEVLTEAAAFRILQPEWLQLLARLPFQSVFFTPQWQETWWRHFGAGRQLFLLTARSSDGTLQGLAPLMVRQSDGGPAYLELIGDLEWCDYLDILIAPTYQHDVGQALAHALVTRWGNDIVLCLQNLSPSSPTLEVFHECLSAYDLNVELKTIETCPVIALPEDWETYLGLLRGKDRHELRRKLRRAETAATLDYYVTQDAARLDADIETFIALHRMSQQGAKQGFMTPSKALFFRDLVHQLWPAGWLELAFLSADSQPIAALCCFAFGTTYAAYNSGYHPDYSHLSAGIVLFAERIRSAIARRFTVFDFLRGNEAYKYRFGATDRLLSQLLARTACPVEGSCV